METLAGSGSVGRSVGQRARLTVSLLTETQKGGVTHLKFAMFYCSNSQIIWYSYVVWKRRESVYIGHWYKWVCEYSYTP